MGLGSIWHWAIFIAALALYFGPPIAGIIACPKSLKTSGQELFFWVMGGVLLTGIVWVTMQASVGSRLGLVLPFAVLAYQFFCARATAGRLQDIGASRWWALLILIFSIVVPIVLIFVPPRTDPSA